MRNLKQRCRVMIDEYNYDIAERSWHIERDENVLGRTKIAASFGEASRKSGHRITDLIDLHNKGSASRCAQLKQIYSPRGDPNF